MTIKTTTQHSLYELSSFSGTEAAVSLFGDPRYDEEHQLSNPDKQMTRVCKDVLRVGRWKVGYTDSGDPVFWEVTPQVLNELELNFAKQKKKGIEHPLCWGHVEQGKADIDSREVLSQIDEVKVIDDTLWISTYVNPVQSTTLQNTKRQVSIGSLSEYEDGAGETFPGWSLIHVAVVEHPVVHAQNGFVQLSLMNTNNAKGKRKMFTLEPWVKALNSFLPAGSDIPLEGDGAITEDNADEMLALVMSLTGNKPAEESSEEGSADGEGEVAEIVPDTGDTPAIEELPVEMQNQIRKDPALLSVFKHFTGKLSKAQNELALLQASERKSKKDAYESQVDRMGKAGLDGVTVLDLKKRGQSMGYDLSLLKSWEKLCDRDLMSAQTMQLSNAQPNNPSVKKQKSQEDIDRQAKALL